MDSYNNFFLFYRFVQPNVCSPLENLRQGVALLGWSCWHAICNMQYTRLYTVITKTTPITPATKNKTQNNIKKKTNIGFFYPVLLLVVDPPSTVTIPDL